jgi:hypothetical protein
VPNAFNGHYELDPGNGTQWRRSWAWARGGGGNNRILKLLATPDAPYSTPQMRNGAPANTFVEQTINYLAPETTNRYAPILDGDGDLLTTFCNIFVNDATRVLWCEIPNNPANTVVGFMRQWLDQSGGAAGWTKTTDGNAAQNHANNGHVAVMIWSKGTASDHVALVRPGTGEAHGSVFFPRIAQAGKVVSSDISSHVTLGFVVSQDSTALAFYLHD